MAIKKSFSKVIAPGEHKVTVVEVEKTKTAQTQKDMLKIVFESAGGEKINSYFVKENEYALRDLGKLKMAAGLKMDSPSDELVGLRVGICVEPELSKKDGKTYMRVKQFGKESDVEEQQRAPAETANEITW